MRRNMVSTGRSPFTHIIAFVTPLLVSFILITIGMSAIDGLSTESSDYEKKHYGPRGPVLPSEEPSEIELENWVRDWTNALREANYLRFITETPVKTAEYTAKPRIDEPTGASDALKSSIVLKNHEIDVINAERDVRWQEYIRGKNDAVAAMLTTALRPKADMRLKALTKAHTYPAPNSDQLNGGAMFRALAALMVNA